ncbi:MAG: hypothetical protein Q8S43_08890 [Actinomycetota bacterium]|nr:MAG: hypothetical protein FD171_236 [Actinomycetota bacterium]MDO8949446.1 hypothetical protein [Actinomycetota bacterium]MDP3631045.1 hypothetical protein [Actinomycetota bacterium]
MTDSAGRWIERIKAFLGDRGYAISESPIGTSVLAIKHGHSFGPFLPYTDFFFIHDLSTMRAPTTFEALHGQARLAAEAQYRLPRALRYHIPNTVSIGVSVGGLSAETIEFAQRDKRDNTYIGGEKNSTYLFDVETQQLYSQGIEITPARYGARVVTTVNPTNRTHELMEEILRMLVGQGD